MQYKGYNDEKKASSMVANLETTALSRNSAYGFFKNFQGNYCCRTMFVLKDPNNVIRYDVIRGPIRALLNQAANAGLQNTEEYKGVVKALTNAKKRS